MDNKTEAYEFIADNLARDLWFVASTISSGEDYIIWSSGMQTLLDDYALSTNRNGDDSITIVTSRDGDMWSGIEWETMSSPASVIVTDGEYTTKRDVDRDVSDELLRFFFNIV